MKPLLPEDFPEAVQAIARAAVRLSSALKDFESAWSSFSGKRGDVSFSMTFAFGDTQWTFESQDGGPEPVCACGRGNIQPTCASWECPVHK